MSILITSSKEVLIHGWFICPFVRYWDYANATDWIFIKEMRKWVLIGQTYIPLNI